ncbi:MAG: hypothetical protein WCA28_20750 [Bradyrhizobium sp.]
MVLLIRCCGDVRLRTRQQRFLDSASEGALGERIKRLFDHFEKELKLRNIEQLSISRWENVASR